MDVRRQSLRMVQHRSQYQQTGPNLRGLDLLMILIGDLKQNVRLQLEEWALPLPEPLLSPKLLSDESGNLCFLRRIL